MMTIRKFWRAWTSNTVIGIALLALALIGGITNYIQFDKTSRIAECTAAYQIGFAQAIKARTEPQQQYRFALNNLFYTLYTEPDAAKRRTAFEVFVTEAREQDQALAARPIPDPVFCQDK
jgi:hypothetical protein